MKLHLIQPQELYGPEEREAELLYCWHQNAAIFDVVTAIQGRPDFSELFAMCLPDHVNVIANSDIYFDHTLRENSDTLDPDQCWALSRWEDLGGTTLLPYHRSDSQDAWVVRGGPWTVDAPFPMGIPGCDNAIAYELKAMGLDVINPCRTVHAIHLHTSNYRTYGEGRGKPKAYRITPPYHWVQPCSL
jgi:hypothetical protein